MTTKLCNPETVFAVLPKYCENTGRWVWLRNVVKSTMFTSWDDYEVYYLEIV